MSRTERLTDIDERVVAAAESDLNRLLSVEPSADFAARVRSHIHESGVSHSTRWGWIGLALASTAAIILAVVVLRPAATDRVQIVRSPDITLGTPISPAENVPSATTTPKPVAKHTPVLGMKDVEASSEVIVDAAMTDAIRRMARSLRNTSPDATVAEQLRVDHADATPLAVPEPLTVPELLLKPAEQTGGQ